MKIFDVEINDEIYYSVKEVFNIFLLDDRIKEFYFVNHKMNIKVKYEEIKFDFNSDGLFFVYFETSELCRKYHNMIDIINLN